MAFGLYSTDTSTGYKSIDSRRKIFKQFPGGAAPLMGLLSMLPSEDTDKEEFGWFEERFPVQRTQTVASGTAPFANGDGSAFTDTGTMTENVEYRVTVLTTAEFKPTHVIEIREVVYTAGATKSIKGVVTEVISSTVLKFRPFDTTAGVENGSTDNNSLYVVIIGNANQEGGRSGVGMKTVPINPKNYTQIFRTAFSLTRTALKGGLVYDKSGPYKTMAATNGLRHMIEMEKAFFWGTKHVVNVTDPDTGESLPERTMGGVYYFLEEWEEANSIYRGGTGAAAVTANTDDDKRIINVGGTLNRQDYNKYISRLFRKTNDKMYEKICFCGGTFLEVVNSLFEKQVTQNVMLEEKGTTFKFIVHSHTTLRGTVHYKVHPLFDEDPGLQGSAMFLDLGNLMYRPLSDSDTVFLKGRQETDRDGRKDEWITECGLELKFPESNMYMKNVTQAG